MIQMVVSQARAAEGPSRLQQSRTQLNAGPHTSTLLRILTNVSINRVEGVRGCFNQWRSAAQNKTNWGTPEGILRSLTG